MIKIGLIGPGRVGRTLALALPREQYRLSPVLSRTYTSARRAVRQIADGTPTASIEHFSGCDVVLVAVPDVALAGVVQQLRGAQYSLAKKVVLHTSRLHDSSDLGPLHDRGAAVGSLQPVFPFLGPVPSLAGLLCAIEGDPAATRTARGMVRSWNGQFQLVRAEEKLCLGIATSMASDLFVGTLEMALREMTAAGFSRRRGLKAISKILDATLDDYARSGRRCRVGPLLRGDTLSVQRYIEGLRRRDSGLADAYRRTARETLAVLNRNNDEFSFLDDANASVIRAFRAGAARKLSPD